MNVAYNSNGPPDAVILDGGIATDLQRKTWLVRQVVTLGRALPPEPEPEPVEPLSAYEIFYEKLQQAIHSAGYYFTILDEVVERYPELLLLLLHTESMENEVKQYWFDILPTMDDEKIDRLFSILQTEHTKLAELEIKYQEEIKELNRVHQQRLNWMPRLTGADGGDLLGLFQSGKSGSDGGAVTLGQDGRVLYFGHHNGRLVAWDIVKGKKLWHISHPPSAISAIALSPDGTHLAAASADKTIRIWDSKTGVEIQCLKAHKAAVQCLVFSPDNAHLASGSDDQTIILWEVASGKKLKHWKGRHGNVLALAFSPYGLELVSASTDGIIRMRDIAAVVRTRRSIISQRPICAIAFSTNGQYVAAVTEDNLVQLWHGRTHEKVGDLPRHEGEVTCLAFSPDDQYLATAQSGQGNIRIWDIESRTERLHVTFPEKYLSGLAWAPNGTFLVACVGGNIARFFDTRVPEMRTAPENTPPHFFSDITHIWAAIHGLGIAAPLSLLNDLNNLLARQQGKLHALQRQPGLISLQLLQWPQQARIGLIALLLNRWPEASAWQPESNVQTAVLRRALFSALINGNACPPEVPQPPLVWLGQALEQVDERLLTLLDVLGPESVAIDPGLPLRLLSQLEQVIALSPAQRKRLGLRLATQQTGLSQSSSTGSERSGFSSIGPITALLPSQWAYSRQLLAWQHQNGGLLYRTRIGHEQPHLPPVVILLDTSPACWGAIEAITRPAAHALAETLASQNRPTVLLTAGDNQVHYLNRPEERLKIFTHRSMKAVDVLLALEKAQALRRELRVDGVEPLIVLLTHCWWGADTGPCKPQSRLRALLVQFPGDVVQPRIAAHFERCEAVAHNQFSALASVLQRLIT